MDGKKSKLVSNDKLKVLIARIEKSFIRKGLKQTVNMRLAGNVKLRWEEQKLWLRNERTGHEIHASEATISEQISMGAAFSILYDELKRRQTESRIQTKAALERVGAFAERLENEE